LEVVLYDDSGLDEGQRSCCSMAAVAVAAAWGMDSMDGSQMPHFTDVRQSGHEWPSPPAKQNEPPRDPRTTQQPTPKMKFSASVVAAFAVASSVGRYHAATAFQPAVFAQKGVGTSSVKGNSDWWIGSDRIEAISNVFHIYCSCSCCW
jgi:hypothetical protein